MSKKFPEDKTKKFPEDKTFKFQSHQTFIDSILNEKVIEKLSPHYTIDEGEIRQGFEQAAEFRDEDWSSLRFMLGEYAHPEELKLDETNAKRMGKPDLQGNPKYEYQCHVLDELSFILVCRDGEGKDVMSIVPAVGGNVVS